MKSLKNLIGGTKKRWSAICATAMGGAVSLSAQATIAELESQTEKVLKLFSGKIIAIIMCVALMVIFAIIGWGASQGEASSTIKKVTPWIIAVIGIGSAAGITSYFLGVSVK